jgi:hypothetical protein
MNPWIKPISRMAEMHPWRRWKNTPEPRGGFPPQGTGWHRGGAGRPHLAGSRTLPRCGVLWYPLEPSHVYVTKLSRDIF